ncbi:Silkworm transposon mag-like protein [Operophtera brumata]|nr:Silkworm transposon mag-like protein [Operophtera brumata]KOB67872.1 Silkworm transposon mag-like protein [Operophtera brumata]KOB70766.1 Silkworm transposon mag-like protein [Operophtera brumata]
MVQVQQRQVDNAGGANRVIDSGDDVWYRQYLKADKWLPGKVESCLGPSNFKVIGEEGTPVHRHIDQLKRRTRSSLVHPDPESPKLDSDLLIGQDHFQDAEDDEEVTQSEQAAQRDVPSQSPKSSPVMSPEPLEPPSDKPPTKLSPRPIRQCRLNKPNYKL